MSQVSVNQNRPKDTETRSDDPLLVLKIAHMKALMVWIDEVRESGMAVDILVGENTVVTLRGALLPLPAPLSGAVDAFYDWREIALELDMRVDLLHGDGSVSALIYGGGGWNDEN